MLISVAAEAEMEKGEEKVRRDGKLSPYLSSCQQNQIRTLGGLGSRCHAKLSTMTAGRKEE